MASSDRILSVSQRPDGSIHIKGYPDAVHLGRLSSAAAKRLAEFEIHARDLRLVADPLQLVGNLTLGNVSLPQVDRRKLIDVLWAGIIVSYCRCFDPARAPNQLLEGDVYGNKPEALETHRYIFSLRSKHFAHDVNEIRQSLVGVALDAKANNLDIVRLTMDWQHGPDHFQNMINLVDDAYRYVAAERTRLVAELVAEVAAMSPEQRLGLPAVQSKFPKDMKSNRRR